MSLRLQLAATDAPVSLPDAKLHLRITGTDEDTLISSLVLTATLDAEHIMGRALMPQKWLATLDCFAASIDLQRPPVSAIDSVKYIDAVTGVQTTVSSSVYQLINGSDYTARVVPAYGQVWPSARTQPEAVQIVFSCGYADAASVPEPIKSWIKLRLGSLYENRESTVILAKSERLEDLPFVDSLLNRYRTWLA